MGKRSQFPRIKRDLYRTPQPAVLPLVPFLKGIKRFAEPCCGEGDLVCHLEGLGLRPVYTGDIAMGRDALARDFYGRIDAIITNPPHTRPLMHELIVHFQDIAPTWLLIDLDWVANLQAVPYLKHCSDIVVIGRVKWIAGTPHTGKENYGWYRFHGKHLGPTKIHNRRT
jgi:hypothetical protein